MKKQERGTVLVTAILTGTILLSIAILITISINSSMGQSNVLNSAQTTGINPTDLSMIKVVLNATTGAPITTTTVAVGSYGLKSYTYVLNYQKTTNKTQTFNLAIGQNAAMSPLYVTLKMYGGKDEWTINNNTGISVGGVKYVTTTSSAITGTTIYTTQQTAKNGAWSVVVNKNLTTTAGYIMYARVFYK